MLCEPVEQWSLRRIVVGLGNPGAEYEATRHNLGWRVVDELARRHSLTFDRRDCQADLAVADELLLVKPLTFMNRSGYALRCLVERRGVGPEQMLIVFDDVALPLGRMRLRMSGSSGGQRGLASILEALRTDRIHRLRIGIGNDQGADGDLADFVLSPFDGAELATVDAQVDRAADACEAWLQCDVDQVMNDFNN